MSYRLAVDLGTAFAAAAVLDAPTPTMLTLGNRMTQMPSVLFLSSDGSFLVGEPAERRGLTEPHRLVREFKRRFGDPVPLLVAGSAYSPESLMARLLRFVVDRASTQHDEAPSELVLTHPANWGPYKRELFTQVAALAGAPPARFCTEPEAAAVRYAARTRVEVGDRIVVYDLGGGTFDVCVLEKTADGFDLIGAPDGVEHLGGADIDESMTDLVLRTLAPQLDGADLEAPDMVHALARLRRDCVEAKEALSVDTEVTIPVTLPGVSTTVRVNRAELEAVIRPALSETVECVRRTLASARLTPADLRGIVMVGGSSRIPLVGELLQNAFGVPLNVDTHPKHDIALGAALLAGRSADEPARAVGSAKAVRPPVRPAEEKPADQPDHPPVSGPPVSGPPVSDPPVGDTAVRDLAVTDPAVTDPPVLDLATNGTPSGPTGRRPPSGRPPVPAASGRPLVRRRTVLIAAAAAVAVLVAATAIWIGGQNDRPNSSQGGSASASASGGGRASASASTGTEVTGSPTVAELLGHIPADYRDTCRPLTDDLDGAAVKLGCDPSNEAIHSVTHWQYASQAAFEQAAARQFGGEPPGDCTRGPGETPYSHPLPDGRTRSGRLLCTDSEGAITIISTTDQLWVLSIVDTERTSGWTYANLKGSWDQYPLQ